MHDEQRIRVLRKRSKCLGESGERRSIHHFTPGSSRLEIGRPDRSNPRALQQSRAEANLPFEGRRFLGCMNLSEPFKGVLLMAELRLLLCPMALQS